MQIQRTVLVLLALLAVGMGKEPPTFNYPYYISFEQTDVQAGKNYTVNGQLFYDPLHNRERLDLSNGKNDRICGTVLPLVSTPCIHYIVNNKRWIVYPLRNQCCFCCDSAHGCGILSPTWLSDAQYLGKQSIGGTPFDKWSKKGFGYNYLWVTQNESIPRKLDEGGNHIKDFQVENFVKGDFEESVFALPPFCSQNTNCPLQSRCGLFRSS